MACSMGSVWPGIPDNFKLHPTEIDVTAEVGRKPQVTRLAGKKIAEDVRSRERPNNFEIVSSVGKARTD